jgi:actin-related protein 8
VDKLYLQLKQRLKDLKIRPHVGAAQQVIQFNQNAQPETIQDHNDPYKVEWIDVATSKPSYLVGKDVLFVLHILHQQSQG